MQMISDFLSKYGNYIVWVPTILFSLIMLYQILVGLIRGFRKNIILFAIEIISFISAYMVFFFVLRRSSVQTGIINLVGNFVNVQDTLGIPSSADTFKEIVEALVDKYIESTSYASLSDNIKPYASTLALSLLGIVYMFITFIMTFIFKGFYYIFYLIFFKEGRKKKKMKKAYEDYMLKSQTVDEDGNPVESEEAKGKAPKVYKKRKLLGATVGVARGVFSGVLALAIFGILNYSVMGDSDVRVQGDEKISITYNGSEYDLTEFYSFMDDFDSCGVNLVLEKMGVNDVPFYTYIPSQMFMTEELIIEEDGVKTKVNAVEEIGKCTAILHNGVELLNKYNIEINNTTALDTVVELVENNPDFTEDVYNLINSIGTTKLHKALGKTINNNFVKILKATGLENKYTEAIFEGENAIGLSDLASKSDIKPFVNLAAKALTLYNGYKDSDSDAAALIINYSEDVSALVDDMLDLSVFKSTSATKINNIISDLMVEVTEKVSQLEGLNLTGITWISSDENVKGDIVGVMTALKEFLSTNAVKYDTEEKTILFNLSKLNAMFDKDGGESPLSLVYSSDIVRRVASKYISNTKIQGKTLYIPSESYDEYGSIKKSEFASLFEGVEDIVKAVNFKDEYVALSKIQSEAIPQVINDLKSYSLLSEKILSSSLLKSVASKTIYDLLVDQELSQYITTDLALDTDEHIQANMDAWVSNDGELKLVIETLQELYQEDVVGYNYTDKKVTYDLTKISTLTSDDSSKLMTNLPDSILLRELMLPLVDKYAKDTLDIITPSTSYTLKEDIKIVNESEVTNMLKSAGLLLSKVDIKNVNVDELSNIVIDIVKNGDELDKLKGSTIIEATISKIVYDSFSTELSGVPDSLLLDDANIDTNILNWVGENKEYSNLLDALNGCISVNFLTIDMTQTEKISYDLKNVNYLFDGTNPVIDRVLSSLLTQSIISNAIETLDIGYTVYLPSSVYDTNELISKEELKNMLLSATVITSSVDLDSATVADDIKNKLSEICSDDANVDKILNSVIMSGTLSSAVYDVVTTMSSTDFTFSVPENLSLASTVADTNMANWIGEGKELSKLLNIMSFIDIANITNADFVFKLTDTEVDDIMASNIVASSITDTITTTTVDDISIIVINEALNNGYITSLEVKTLLKAIKAICDYDTLTDEEKEAFSLNTLNINISTTLADRTKLDAILDSLILSASVSYKAYELVKDTIEVPTDLVMSDKTDRNIYNWISLNGKTGELEYLVDALDVLGLTSTIMDGINVDINNVITTCISGKSNEEIASNANTILTSSIAWKTISTKLIEFNSSLTSEIKVPDSVIVSGSVTKTEITNLFVAIGSMGISDVDAVSEDIIITNNIDTTVILESSIIWYTMSNIIENSSSVIVPLSAVDNTIETERYIRREELTALVSAVKEINPTSIGSIDENNLLASSVDISIVMSSEIIHYTVSDKLVAASKEVSAMIKIPSIAYITSTDVIKSDEIEKLILSARSLNIENISNVTADDILASDLNFETILASDIMWFTVSYNVSTSGIEMSSYSYDVTSTDEEVYISKTEIEYTVDAIKLLKIDSIDSVNVTASQVLALTTDEVNTLLKSYIVWLQVTNTVTDSSITIPTPAYATDEYMKTESGKELETREAYLTKEEVVSLLEGLNILNITDFNNVTVTSDTLFSEPVKSSMDDILSSYILWDQISSKIKESISDITAYAYDGYDITNMISKSEIKNTIEALDILEISIDTSVVVNANKLLSLSSTDIEKLLSSYIVWQQITINVETSVGETNISSLAYATEEYMETVTGSDIVTYDKFITKEEVRSLLAGLNTLKVTDFNDITVTSETLFSETVKSSMDDILSSYILWDQISSKIEGSISDITDYAYDGYNPSGMISKTEIKNTIEALDILEISIDTSVVVDPDKLLTLSETDMDKLLLSYIVWQQITINIVSNVGDINISNEAYATDEYMANVTGSDIVATSRFITKEEVINLINGVNNLGIISLNNPAVSGTVLFGDDLDLNATLDSYILWYMISDNISASVNIPADTRENDSFIKKTEIINMVSSLKTLGVTSTDSVDIDENKLLEFNDSQLDSILLSSIVWYEISLNIISSVGASDVPDGAYLVEESLERTEDFLKKTEIKSLIQGLNDMGVTNLTTFTVPGSALFNVTDFDALLASYIIWNNVSIQVRNAANVPDEAYLDETLYIEKTEIESMVASLSLLGVTTTDNLSINPDDLLSISDDDMNTVLLSSIVWYEISLNVISSVGSADVADEAYLEEDYNLRTEEFLKKTEIKSLIQSLNVIGVKTLTSFNVPGTAIFNITDFDAFLTSYIIWRKVSTQIDDAANVPEQAYLVDTTFIEKIEIESMIASLRLLGVTTTDNLSINPDDLLSLTDDNMNTVLLSSIVWYEISLNVITSVGDADVPVEAYLVEDSSERTENFLKKTEIISLIQGLNDMGVKTLTSFSVPGTTIFNITDFDAFLTSYIIWGKVSSQISECAHVPAQACIENTSYIEKTEIESMITSLKLFEITTTDNLDIDANKLFNLSDQEFDTVLLSSIVWYEISLNIIENIGYSEMPAEAYLEEDSSQRTEDFLKKTEIKALIASLDVMGLNDMNDVNITDDQIFEITDYDTFLGSFIIWDKVSDKIKTNNEIIVGSNALDDVYPGYISKTEIHNLVDAVHSISGETASLDVAINVNPGSLNDEQIDLIVTSLIMQTTVTDMIFIDNELIIVDDTLYITQINDLYGDSIYSYTESEVRSLLIGCRALGISELSGNMQVSLSTFASLDSAVRTTVLESGSLYAEISKLVINHAELSLLLTESDYVSIDTIKYDFTTVDTISVTGDSLLNKDTIINLDFSI